jgi:hypothetical protein
MLASYFFFRVFHRLVDRLRWFACVGQFGSIGRLTGAIVLPATKDCHSVVQNRSIFLVVCLLAILVCGFAPGGCSVHVVAVSLSFVIPPHKRDRSILVVLNAPAHPWLKLRATLRVVRLHGQQIYTRRGRGELERAHLSLPLFLLPLHLWHLPLISVRPPFPPRFRGGGWRLIIFHVLRGCVSHKQI